MSLNYKWEKNVSETQGHLVKAGEICPLVYHSFYLYGRSMSPCKFFSATKTGEICPYVGYA